MSDACTEINIDGHNAGRFARPGDEDPVEFEGLGPVTGDPHQDLAHLFEDAWDWSTDGGSSVGMGGWSKYEQVELHAYARGYTALVPGSTATVTLEWHGDGGPLREVMIYRDGAHVGGTHTEDVPDTLPELLRAVRAAIAACLSAAEGDSNDAEFEAAAALREAAGALADALDPRGAAG